VPDSNTPGSEPLSNPRHERFALLLAQSEVSAAEAYRQEISSDCTASTAETKGPALSRKSQVRVRIEWLKGQVTEKAKEIAADAVLSMLEKRLFCARIIRSKPSDATMENPDCELVMTKMGPCALFPSKATLIKLDNDLAGDGSEAEGMTALVELARRLRA
jgi:hypothetical protein